MLILKKEIELMHIQYKDHHRRMEEVGAMTTFHMIAREMSFTVRQKKIKLKSLKVD